MEDLVQFYEECGRQDQSETFKETNDEVTILELARDNESGLVELQKLRLSGSHLSAWIVAETHQQSKSIVLQLLQINLEADSYSSHRRLDISRKNYDYILRKFGLLDVVGYGTSATQVFNQVSETSQGRTCTYSTIHIDDYFTLFHKHDSDTRLVQGVYWAKEAILPYLERAITHLRVMADDSFFLNMCTSVSFGAVLDSRLSTISDEIARIERRTGFKAWDLGRYKPAQGDSYALSATASGYATTLAANKRLNRLTGSILSSYRGQIKDTVTDPGSSNTCTTGKVAVRVELLLQRNETQRVLIDYLTARLENQLRALFNLITQTDTRITISLAKDSRTIASASKHDSSSMKALAAVTVMFLPGTFISSLFSTSIFDWQAETDSAIVNKRFWIYWAITLPLTLVTIFVWLSWTGVEDYLHREKEFKTWTEDKDDNDPSV